MSIFTKKDLKLRNSFYVVYLFQPIFNIIFVLITVGLMISPSVFAKGRALLIISELDAGGLKELQPLYRTLERLTWSIPTRMPFFSSLYSKQILITGEAARIVASQDSVVELLKDSSIEGVDLILGVHGLPEKLAFYDGTINVAEWVGAIKQKMQGLGHQDFLNKLGFLYNLSCYGASHNPFFLDLGFRVVIGSRSVNANAEVEFPWVLQMLSVGASIHSAFLQPNSTSWLKLADGPVRWWGRKQNNFLQETDSFKVIGGDSYYSLPRSN